MKVDNLKLNRSNPRFIKDDKFKKLVKSLSEFPKMMALRPIIYDPESKEILGGNMRFRALKELGYKDIPDEWIKSADQLDEVRILRDAKMNDRFYIKKDLLIHNIGVYLSGNETNEDYLNL